MSQQLKQYRQRGERITRGYLQNKFDETIHNIYTSHFYAYEEKIRTHGHIHGYMLRAVQDILHKELLNTHKVRSIED